MLAVGFSIDTTSFEIGLFNPLCHHPQKDSGAIFSWRDLFILLMDQGMV